MFIAALVIAVVAGLSIGWFLEPTVFDDILELEDL